MCVALRTKFQVSRVILTSLRQGGNFNSPPPQNKLLESPPRLGLTALLIRKILQIIWKIFLIASLNIIEKRFPY